MSEIPVRLEALQHESGRTELRLINESATDPNESVLCSMIVREVDTLVQHPTRFLTLLLATMQIQHADLQFRVTENDVEQALVALELPN